MTNTSDERLYLIRHGCPYVGWGGVDPDPGLNELGREQARIAAQVLLALPSVEMPRFVVSSPLRRCRETAQPLAEALGADLEINLVLGEIPTPSALTPEDRPAWLRAAMAGRWSEIEGDLDYDRWRHDLSEAVSIYEGYAMFTHFVAINAVLSVLAGDERVIAFRPDHASVTTLGKKDGALLLLKRGAEATTGVT